MSTHDGSSPGSILGVKGDEGHVILTFPNAITWLKLDPATAREVAEEMARCSFKAEHKELPSEKRKSLLGEQIRQKLVNRLAIVLRDLSARAKPFDYQAKTAVDIVLSEMVGE